MDTAIGVAHGCIEELHDFIRECNYQPGDLVVFQASLVCKGPASISVVKWPEKSAPSTIPK
jgi:hypothetical protein